MEGRKERKGKTVFSLNLTVRSLSRSRQPRGPENLDRISLHSGGESDRPTAWRWVCSGRDVACSLTRHLLSYAPVIAGDALRCVCI